jgi:glycerol dehydrogenase-like iron-containing ADH family enzyme
MDRWSDLEWRDPLKILIHWYVESNLQAGAIEGSMIMTQSAFELLFDLLLNRSSTRVKADGKLKRLLEYANLPTNLSDIPCDADTLEGLREFATKENKDAPKIITEIRNIADFIRMKYTSKIPPSPLPCGKPQASN